MLGIFKGDSITFRSLLFFMLSKNLFLFSTGTFNVTVKLVPDPIKNLIKNGKKILDNRSKLT